MTIETKVEITVVAWEFRSNSWPEGSWTSITKAQYDGYLRGDVTGPRDSWQVRALCDADAVAELIEDARSVVEADRGGYLDGGLIDSLDASLSRLTPSASHGGES